MKRIAGETVLLISIFKWFVLASMLGRRVVRYNRSVVNFEMFTGISKMVKSVVTTGKTRIKLPLLVGVMLFWPDQALAVQQHGGTEGLVAHQIGHILFFAGIVYLLYKIFRTNLNEPGWFEFKFFLWLIIGWNLLTFSGHWMRELVDQAAFFKVDDRTVSYAVNGVGDAYFYLTRLDHLLLVPAFIFLLLALRKWGEQP